MFKDDSEPAPFKPHLAIVTETGLIALKKNQIIAIVEDARKPDGIFYLAIESVSHRKLVFKAVSSDKSSTRTVTFTADWKGDYKSWVRQAKQVQDAKQTSTAKGGQKVSSEPAKDYDPTDYF